MGGSNARKNDPSQLSSNAEQRRIDVRVELDEAGRKQIILQDLSYGPGIGWYAQKTIRLDPEQLEALMGALSCARQESRRMGKGGANTKVPKDSTDGLSKNTARQILQLADYLDPETS
jgi:hypothetical protein